MQATQGWAGQTSKWGVFDQFLRQNSARAPTFVLTDFAKGVHASIGQLCQQLCQPQFDTVYNSNCSLFLLFFMYHAISIFDVLSMDSIHHNPVSFVLLIYASWSVMEMDFEI